MAKCQAGKLFFKFLILPYTELNPSLPFQKQTLNLLEYEKGLKIYFDLIITFYSLAKIQAFITNITNIHL